MKIKWLLFICCFFSISLYADEDRPYGSTYLAKRFLDHIDSAQIKTILEIGSHHGKDAVLLYNHYNCPVFVFEASPINIDEVKQNIEGYENIHLISKAVWDKSEIIDFFHCVNHPGSSACYQFDFPALAKREKRTLNDALKKYRLEKFSVEATRLDDWLEENELEGADLICMDLQGAELPALKSLGKYLSTVKYVITEVEYEEIYEGEALFPEINSFMKSQGFTCFFQLKKGLFNDVIFVRNELIKTMPAKKK